ncbi:MAG: glycosyltransferase [Acidobacteria bacterium]|nr:glycosyltransferase [Acidobacteriota bacterium]MBI3662907.1 glycosyltransferase [Acidobacteriota bacterium]
MHTFWSVFFGILALLWILQAVRATLGMRKLPRIANTRPLSAEECASVSVIFAARDEAEKLPPALATMLAQDFPRCEVVAVNDRSGDATPQILDEAASRHANLNVAHVEELPPGWLGKPHALQKGYEQSSGEWIVFTDADVRFAPDLLRRALSVAREKGWDHLTLLTNIEMDGFWETVAITSFGMAFGLGVRPWEASDRRSRSYIGVGAFQMVRRSVYEAIGTHRRLAMEVIDDMKLGKLVKEGGYRSGAGISEEWVTLRWHEGLGNIIRGTTKNFFASSGYNLPLTLAQIAALLMVSVVPFVALPFVTGWARMFAAICALLAVAAQGRVAYHHRVSLLYGLTHPIGALIFCWMLLRSMTVTLWQGGVTWRGTFYPLEELRKGIV